MLGQHGEQVAPPVAPFRVDLVRLGKGYQMADGPGHHVAVAVQIAVAPAGRAQHARDITRHRGLFGQHGNGTGFRIRHDKTSGSTGPCQGSAAAPHYRGTSFDAGKKGVRRYNPFRTSRSIVPWAVNQGAAEGRFLDHPPAAAVDLLVANRSGPGPEWHEAPPYVCDHAPAFCLTDHRRLLRRRDVVTWVKFLPQLRFKELRDFFFSARQPVANAHRHNPTGPATNAEEKSPCDGVEAPLRNCLDSHPCVTYSGG